MMTHSKPAGLVAIAVAAFAADPPESNSVSELIRNINDKDDTVRGPAWQKAGPYGAPAVKPLAKIMADADFEIARAAKRGLWNIVRHAGRPGADAERKAVAAELVQLLVRGDTSLRREVLSMLSEIGDDEAVKPVAAFLFNPDLWEEARAALERIPGAKSLAALKSGLATAPEDHKPALAHSLRVRGVKVDRYPSEKLTPKRKTDVKTLSAR